MSLNTMILRTATRCNFEYQSQEIGDGGQITKTWKKKYQNIACVLQAMSSSEAQLFYQRYKIFADFKLFIEYKSGINERQRVTIGERIFNIYKIDNWDAQNSYLRIALLEVT